MKIVEGDKISLRTIVKSVEDALDEGGKIFKSCLFLSNFIADIDKKIRDPEGKLAGIGHSFAPHPVFPSSLEAQIMDLSAKTKALHK